MGPTTYARRRRELTEWLSTLLKELDESFKKGGHKHSPNDKGWFEKAKDFFS